MTHQSFFKKARTLIAFAFVFPVVACVHEAEEREFSDDATNMNTNLVMALAGQGDLSMFYQALINTGVASELRENTKYSIFAPTNEAFSQIQAKDYPCFYSTQCRDEMAVVLRNHIVPRNESIYSLSQWGGNPIPTIGDRGIHVEETFNNDFTVEGHSILYRNVNDTISLYRIDGVIVNGRELTPFRAQPVANVTDTMTEETVTTYRAPVIYQNTFPSVPGGSSATDVIFMPYDGFPGDSTQTTTVTHTTTTR